MNGGARLATLEGAGRLAAPFLFVMVVAALAVIAFPLPVDFGYQPAARTWILYAATGLTVVSVFLSLAGRDMLWVALLAPFLVQYYQVALGWEVELGSTSPLRLVPLAGVLALLGIEAVRRRPQLSRVESTMALLWQVGCLIWLLEGAASAGSPVVLVTWVLTAGVAPLCYFVVRDRLADPAGRRVVMTTVLVGFLVLVVASIGISFVALDYRGSASLLSARNANDGNIVLGYLMLAWPTALLAARALHPGLVAPLGLAFVVAAVLLFSRGGLVMVPVLVLGSLLVMADRPRRMAAALGIAVVGAGVLWSVFDERLGLLAAWTVRLNVSELKLTDIWSILATAQDQLVSSGRSDIWDYARALFRDAPLTGAGFNSFEALGPGYAEAHSLFFQTAAQMGLVGLAFLYGTLAWWTFRVVDRLGRRDGLTRIRLLQLAGLGSWLLFTHTVGSGLVVTSARGLMANVAGIMLLMIALQSERMLGDPGPTPALTRRLGGTA
ncbi:MAG: O-antigen ligase family protein [Gemmatimonadales bacterium]|nr:O-antigen ligase family protein [Gemmatimonadales bacterium]